MVKVSSAVNAITPLNQSPSHLNSLIEPKAGLLTGPGRMRRSTAMETLGGYAVEHPSKEVRQTDQFSLRLLGSGLYQLAVKGDCQVKTSSNSSSESGIVNIGIKGTSLLHPRSITVGFRSSNLSVRLVVNRGRLSHFYGEHRLESGALFVITVCNKGWDCFVRSGDDVDFYSPSKGFKVNAKLASKDGLESRWRLRPDLTWSPIEDAPVSTAAISLSSFKAELECRDRNFSLKASISVINSRIQSADFIADFVAVGLQRSRSDG